MSLVCKTKLPGVGVRHEFSTGDGDELAVIVHHDGRREILVYDTDDPDMCSQLVSLSEADTQTLAESLGVSQLTESVGEIRHAIEGLAIEWIEIAAHSAAVGASIGAGEFRTKTGSSIVEVLRDDTPIPAPGADLVLAAGDVIVAVGTLEGLNSLRSLFRN
jgi:TrkA domain protein